MLNFKYHPKVALCWLYCRVVVLFISDTPLSYVAHHCNTVYLVKPLQEVHVKDHLEIMVQMLML
jgi:hypothetical protein